MNFLHGVIKRSIEGLGIFWNIFIFIMNLLQGVINRSIEGFICLYDLILYVPSTIFQLNRDGSSWVEPVLS